MHIIFKFILDLSYLVCQFPGRVSIREPVVIIFFVNSLTTFVVVHFFGGAVILYAQTLCFVSSCVHGTFGVFIYYIFTYKKGRKVKRPEKGEKNQLNC